jgi:hypothetical protein
MPPFLTLTDEQKSYFTQYQDNFIELARDARDDISDLFETYPYFKGEDAEIPMTGEGAPARRITTQYQDLEVDPMHFFQRRFGKVDYYAAIPKDKFVVDRMLADPQGPMTRETMRQIMLERRNNAFSALFDPITEIEINPATGQKSYTTKNFPGANQVAHNYSAGGFGQTDTGLTLDKMQSVRKKLFANYRSVYHPEYANGRINVLVNEEIWETFITQRIPTFTGTSAVEENVLHPMINALALAKETNIGPGKDFEFQSWRFRFADGIPKDSNGYYRVPVFRSEGLRKAIKTSRPEWRQMPQKVATDVVMAVETSAWLRLLDDQVYEIKVEV